MYTSPAHEQNKNRFACHAASIPIDSHRHHKTREISTEINCEKHKKTRGQNLIISDVEQFVTVPRDGASAWLSFRATSRHSVRTSGCPPNGINYTAIYWRIIAAVAPVRIGESPSVIRFLRGTLASGWSCISPSVTCFWARVTLWTTPTCWPPRQIHR